MTEQKIHAKTEAAKIMTNGLTEVACAVSSLRLGETEVPVAISRTIVSADAENKNTILNIMQKGQTEVAQAVPRPIPNSDVESKKS